MAVKNEDTGWISKGKKQPQKKAVSEFSGLLDCADHLEKEAVEVDRAADFLNAGSCMQRMQVTPLRLRACTLRDWAGLIRQAI